MEKVTPRVKNQRRASQQKETRVRYVTFRVSDLQEVATSFRDLGFGDLDCSTFLCCLLFHLSLVSSLACLLEHHIRERGVVADPNTTCCNCSLHRVFVDLGACRNSGGRSFGGFFGVCDAVSCILSDTGSLPFSFLRMSSSSLSRYFSPLDNRCFLFPRFFPVFLFFGKDARVVVLNAFRSCSKIIFC